ncbi:uncharacterized protein LOC131998152 isoform X2 [Stomoxys calcitrans]|uniref:uncharacterized protein LOC131998152 isoform X2 n=1 Tax=Stomoxys calcitrans TaxID=35570 RepID=UPI0027E2B06F|nr:uncharacterized protein LOC131998152 isoform X2 [Stomoxys calcitrans]
MAAKRRFNVELNEYRCNHFGTVIKCLECSFTKVSTNNFVTNTAMEFNQELARNSEFRLLVSFQLPKKDKVIKFLDLKMTICDVLSQMMSVPLVKRIIKETRRTSNMPYACPIKANYLYYMANYSITDELFPTYTPYISFNFSLFYFENGKLFASSNVGGATVPK